MKRLLLLALLCLTLCTVYAQVLPENLTHWGLVFPKDEMSGKTIMMAVLSPLKFTEFAGKEPALLNVGFKDRDGILEFTMFYKEGFVSSDGDQYVNIKFDDGPIESFDFKYSINGSTRLISIDHPYYILQKVRKAHWMYLQLSIYGEGAHTMKYNVEHCPVP